MANYGSLLTDINNKITTNGRQEITGQILNGVLTDMVGDLGKGYQFMGVATPSGSPASTDAPIFYIAGTAGTYSGFGGLVVADGEVAILKYDSAWSKVTTPIASADEVSQLGQIVDEIDGKVPIIDNSVDADSDFEVSDEDGHVLLRLYDGHIETKNFNSSQAGGLSVVEPIVAADDLEVSDENDYVVALFKGGHIKTKNFDSANSYRFPDLSDKVWCSLGTSITWYNNHQSGFQKGYQSWMMDKINIGTLVNNGVNAGTLVQLAQNLASLVPVADIYTIEHGVNDWGNSTPVGTLSDYSGDTGIGTFYGAYRKVIDYIYSKNSSAIIILCTPRKARGFNGYLPTSCHGAKGGLYLSQYADAVKAIAEYESLPLCDWYNNAGVNDNNLPLYSIDDALHPNDAGYKAMAQILLEQFIKIY